MYTDCVRVKLACISEGSGAGVDMLNFSRPCSYVLTTGASGMSFFLFFSAQSRGAKGALICYG